MLLGFTMIHDIRSEVGFTGGTPPLQAWSFLPMGYGTLCHYNTSNPFCFGSILEVVYFFISLTLLCVAPVETPVHGAAV